MNSGFSHLPKPYVGKEQMQVASQGITIPSLRRKSTKKTMLDYYFSYFLLALKIACILSLLLLYFIIPVKYFFIILILSSYRRVEEFTIN